MRCVVADDFLTLRRIVRNTLRGLGCDDIVETADGLQAMQACTPDTRLLVTGWTLRGLSGLQLVRKLRASPETAKIRVLMLTGRSQRSSVQQAQEAGVDAYVLKPFRPEELERRLQDLLGSADEAGPPDAAQAA